VNKNQGRPPNTASIYLSDSGEVISEENLTQSGQNFIIISLTGYDLAAHH